MGQLPVFMNLAGRAVVLAGEGEAAQAKRRLIERAGGRVVGMADAGLARIAFVALAGGDPEPLVQSLRAQGLLVNVADRPDLCDFTLPAIVDRAPVVVAIGTGGASAGLAKAVRQRIEALLPVGIGALATALAAGRTAMRNRWPDATARRHALDQALAPGGALDPLAEESAAQVPAWLTGGLSTASDALVILDIVSDDPDALTLRAARLLTRADTIVFDPDIAPAVLARARADATRVPAPVATPPPSGLTVWLRRAVSVPLPSG